MISIQETPAPVVTQQSEPVEAAPSPKPLVNKPVVSPPKQKSVAAIKPAVKKPVVAAAKILPKPVAKTVKPALVAKKSVEMVKNATKNST